MSAPWISGGQVSSVLVERQLAVMLLRRAQEEQAHRAARRCARAWRVAADALGPASGATAVWAYLMRPCATECGWQPGPVSAARVGTAPAQVADGRLGPSSMVLIAMPWGLQQDGLQRACVRIGAERGVRWASVCNGVSWRWYDVARPYARDHLALDLTQADADGRVWHVLWLLAQTASAPGQESDAAGRTVLLDRLTSASARHVTAAAAALRDGVADTLDDLVGRLGGSTDTHVTQIFQWLFLLFAEARSLRPLWHPVYRRSYALSPLIDERAPSRLPCGLHDSLVAISRAGRDGITSPALALPALNGPLFADGPLARWPGQALQDRDLGRLLGRLARGPVARAGRIDFEELGVEHLGTIYEHLMSPPGRGPEPGVARAPGLLRKRTGAFYTPRSLADLLVQRTLEPLVSEASADQILALRVVDPAMGSGALLAAATRYLVAAVHAARVREGRGGMLDLPLAERHELPRRVVEQCLYGVDVNPRAVHVARLSLWLLSLAPDRPLTWLDAHLRVGSSLVGITPAALLARHPGHTPRASRSDGQLTLFELTRWHHEADRTGSMLRELSAQPTETAEDARVKAMTLTRLRADRALASWRTRADLWCGAAMDVAPPGASAWRAVEDAARVQLTPAGGTSRVAHTLSERWQALADAQPCLHWSLEFPDVFDAGRGGFDAVLANPPWEMLRADLGSRADRQASRDAVGPLLRFVRRSGVYRHAGGHINSYQLFLERMLQLLRPGGRLGCLLPGSVLADHGAGALRRHLFDQASVDRLSLFDNRDAWFPIHRSMRVVSVTATAGAATTSVLIDEGEPLRVYDGAAPATPETPRVLTRDLLRQAGGVREPVPAVRSGRDLAVLERLLLAPPLGDAGWALRFGRELNATDDRTLLVDTYTPDACVVVEGKHLHPFVVQPPGDGPWVSPLEAARVLRGEPWRRWRLAYRDVSSPTNLRSLIVALLPPGCLSTHTVFCLRGRVGLGTQVYLCGMLNSLVADWFVRLYLGAHVTTALIGHLPVPRPPPTSPHRRAVMRSALTLLRQPANEDAVVELQARAALLYGLGPVQFARIADSFPRLSSPLRSRMLGLHARLAARQDARQEVQRSPVQGDPDGGAEHRQHAETRGGKEPVAPTNVLGTGEHHPRHRRRHQDQQADVQQGIGDRIRRDQ